jgi:selenocysteine-specific elongation factor
MTVFGTVGHVDHGKTVLLRALTGIDADRLPEERRRGITIDIGYAHLPLPDGGSLDFVDLPGHHDYAGNLLVGAAEIDAALLVVAADSGAEAQTFEHIDVLSALRIDRGVVAVTKVDLVDAAHRRHVLHEIGALVEGTTLERAPIVAVSGRTGEGLEVLRSALISVDAAVRRDQPDASDDARGARLALDRVFGVRGHGIVVTGTLRRGALAVGDEVQLMPGDARGRVRGLQVHGVQERRVAPGGRVAVNVSGCDPSTLRRGVVLTRGPGLVATDRLLVTIDEWGGGRARMRLPVTVHIGTDHVSGTIRWIDEPGTRPRHAMVSLHRPVAAALGDRLVVRAPSPPVVLGGAVVADPRPPKLRTSELRKRLSAARAEEPLAMLLRYRLALPRSEFVPDAIVGRTPTDVVKGAVAAGPLTLVPQFADRLRSEVLERVRRAAPESVALNTLRRVVAIRLVRVGGVARRDADATAGELLQAMSRDGRLALRGTLAFDPQSAEQATMIDQSERRLLAALDTVRPPRLSDAIAASGYPRQAVASLVEDGRLVRVAPDLAFAAPAYRALEHLALQMATRRELSASAFRDAAATSRRHAVAVLDWMTLTGMLRRHGDRHVLGPRAAIMHAQPAAAGPAGLQGDAR